MAIFELIKAFFYGVIEGITEWLPISSTGHLILYEQWFPFDASAEFMEMFRVVIQLGAILAVVLLFFHKLNPFSLKKSPAERRDTFALWVKVLIACVPAGIIGVLFNDKIDELFYNELTVSITLILYGILFIWMENRNRGYTPRVTKFQNLTYSMALFIGVFQVLALIPGTSRSGATILGAMLLGTSRYIAAEFSFYLAIPVMFGASLLKMLKVGFDFTGTEWGIFAVGIITSFVVSIFAIKYLMGYIKKHDFKAFGWYRIVLGLIVLVFFFI